MNRRSGSGRTLMAPGVGSHLGWQDTAQIQEALKPRTVTARQRDLMRKSLATSEAGDQVICCERHIDASDREKYAYAIADVFVASHGTLVAASE